MNKPFHPDFLNDPSFRSWALKTDTEAYRYWEHWLSTHPEFAEEAYTAAELIRGLAEGEAGDTRPESRLPANWARLQAAIAQHEAGKNPEPPAEAPTRSLARGFPRRWLAAATIVLLLGVGLWLLDPTAGQTKVLTARDGSPETFVLPDGSEVTLNAGSELRFQQPGWFAGWNRQVAIAGEGFFEVVTTPDRAPFQVQADGFEVTVLGTRFNVRSRADIRDVVLEEGKVQLALTHDPALLDTLTLQPGQRAVLDTSATLLTLQAEEVNVASYTAWRQGLIVLDDLPVAEVLRQIEQAYGWTLVMEDTSLARQTMKGTLPVQAPEVVRQTMTLLFNLDWQQQGDTVFLREQVKP